jgi:hypothetical protein
MKLLHSILGLSLLLLITGCASTDEVVLDSTQRPHTTSIEVFKDGNVPQKAYKEIAELSFLGPREDELRAQKFFVERARKLGGNAILFNVVLAGQKSGGSMYGYHTSTAWVFKGKVIVYE